MFVTAEIFTQGSVE